MATPAAEVISAVCEHKDIHTIMGENTEIFGSYGDVFDFIRSYYMKHKEVPSREFVATRFTDIELPSNVGATAHHLNVLKSEYVSTRMDKIMITAGSAEAKREMATDERLQVLLTSLSKLVQYTAQAKDVNITDWESAQEYFDKARAMAEANGGTVGISTGFDTIDSAYTTGMSGGHYIVCMGYSGKGKSMLTGLLGVNAWIQGKKVLVLSLEMTPEEYRSRIYAMAGHGHFSMKDLERGDVDPDDFRSWASKSLMNSPDFMIVSTEGTQTVNPHFIQGKIDQYKPDLIILDYLQLMTDNAGTSDMTRRMLNLSRELKLLATANNLPVVAITAVTDEDNDKRDSAPVVSQISWSKGIEYDANLIIAIHRHTDTNLVEVIGRKNRHGDLFAMFFEVDFDRGIWE